MDCGKSGWLFRQRAKGKGKSGGARVITLILAYSEEESEIGLLYIYDKSEQESLTDKELSDILRENGLY